MSSALGALATRARAALPPAYGGVLHLPAIGPLTLPHPAVRTSPLDAYLAESVFDAPSALGTAEVNSDQLQFRLHEGVMRHHHRVLQASEVLRSLRRLSRTPFAHWLAPLARRGTRLRGAALDARTLQLELQVSEFDLESWLRGHALAVVVSPGVGTGPFRPRVYGDYLRLSQFRACYGGAPYLHRVRFDTPRPPEDELRALVLGELDGSWVGDSYLGQSPARSVSVRNLRTQSLVAIGARRSRRAELAYWARCVPRERLRRVGLQAGDRIAQRTGAAPAPGAWSGTRVLAYRDGDGFSRSLAEALVAIFDEAGLRLRAVAGDEAQADFRIVEVVPAHRRTAAADMLGVLGEAREAERALLAAFGPSPAPTTPLPAFILGRRSLRLYLDDDVRGDSLRAMHLPRRRIEAP